MTWWNSFEILSKLQTGLAVFISLVGFLTLTIKLRADHLKRSIDATRTEERNRLDRELKEQTETALNLTNELEIRTREKTPKERLIAFLTGLDPKIIDALATQNIELKGDLGDEQILELNKLLQIPDLAPHLQRLEQESFKISMGVDGTKRVYTEFLVRKSLLKDEEKK